MTYSEKVLLLEQYIIKAKEEYYDLIKNEIEDFGGEGQHYLHVVTENLVHAEEKLCCLKEHETKEAVKIAAI